MKTKPLINIQKLEVEFDQRKVLQDVSLTFNREDQVALIGANGSGKTTLLKVILGLLTPQSGRVEIAQNLRIGYVPQVLTIADRLFPMTVKEVLIQGIISRKSFPRRLNPQDQLEYQKLVNDFELQSLQHQAYGLLSIGQKQIVLFARMMMQKPNIVFLDEPTSSLDINRRDSLYEVLRKLKKQAIPYVIITHDLPSFSRYIKRVIYLEHHVLFNGSYRDFCENKTFSPFIHTHEGHPHESD